jgi:chromosome segregation ATPase
MSADLKEPMDGIESAEAVLEECPAVQDESTTSLAEVFDQLQELSLDLFARHKCLEVSTQQKSESENALGGLVEELQKLHGELLTDHQLTQQGWTDIRAGHQQFLDGHAELREIRDGLREVVVEFSRIKAEVERERNDLQKLCAEAEGHLSQLTTAAAALSEAAAQRKNDSQIADLVEYTKQHEAEWLQQRTALEAELDATRRRAAEQTEALSSQKQLASQQQAEFAGEVKRMQSLLEAMAGQVRGNLSVPGGNTKQPEDDSSVMGSVQAQFETLQRDIKSRQAKRSHEPNGGGKVSQSS